MKMLQKMAVTVLGLCLALCVNVIPAFAMDNDVANDTGTLIAKTAILNDIDKYGSNWGSDVSTDNACVVEDTMVSQSNNGDVIILNTYLNGQNVTITGTPLSKSENGNVTYFDGNVNNADYDVVLFSFEKEIQDSVVYFKGYMQENGKTAGNILKVYLKDNNSTTNDYIVLEIFDYELPFPESNLSGLEVDGLPGAWVAEEFEPFSVEEDDTPLPYISSDSDTRTYNETFYVGDVQQKHTITLEYKILYGNIRYGSHEKNHSTVKVIAKSITVPSSPNLNSSTQSSLYVSALTIHQFAAPFTAFTETKVDGSVYISNGYLGDITVSLGFAGLDVSAELEAVFENSVDVALNDNNYKSYSHFDEYERATRTSMNSNMRLIYKDQFFTVISILYDFKNEPHNGGVLTNRFDVTISNSRTQNSSQKNYSFLKNIRVIQ